MWQKFEQWLITIGLIQLTSSALLSKAGNMHANLIEN